ncbi:MAG TPA: hypothetical protein VM755_01415 [Stellaceae bacterium]|nr:hypothetical protein [Stellaceae bacterium]
MTLSTISTTIAHGITLAHTGSYASPLTVTTSGKIDAGSGDAVFGGAVGGPWKVVN